MYTIYTHVKSVSLNMLILLLGHTVSAHSSIIYYISQVRFWAAAIISMQATEPFIILLH